MPTQVGEVVPKQHWGIYAKRAEQIDAKGNLEIYAKKSLESLGIHAAWGWEDHAKRGQESMPNEFGGTTREFGELKPREVSRTLGFSV